MPHVTPIVHAYSHDNTQRSHRPTNTSVLRHLFLAGVAWLVMLMGTPSLAVAAEDSPFAGAPATHDIRLGSQRDNAGRPNKIMMVIHGGGWAGGEGFKDQMQGSVEFWKGQGWTTVNIDYRSGRQSVPDSQWFYDQVRARYGANATVCTYGHSAGGHIGLMIAATRPDVDCVISEAGPTNLDLSNPAEHEQTTWNPYTRQYDYMGVTYANLTIVAPTWGSDFAANSPMLLMDRMRARMLLNVSAYDQIIPRWQIEEFGRRAQQMPHLRDKVVTTVLPGADGQSPWVHGGTTNAAALAEYRKEIAFAQTTFAQKQARLDAAPDPAAVNGHTDVVALTPTQAWNAYMNAKKAHEHAHRHVKQVKARCKKTKATRPCARVRPLQKKATKLHRREQAARAVAAR